MSLFDVMPIKSLNGRNYFYNAAYNLISPAETYSEKAVEQIAKRYFRQSKPMAFDDFLAASDLSEARSFGLVLTDKCNFRCKYCAYSDVYKFNKGYPSNSMSHTIINDAIGLFVDGYIKSMKKDPNRKFSLMFYGGEPLLEFDLIQHSVDLILNKYNIINPIFTLTTNGYYMTSDMIDFFVRHNFDLNFSIDGYRENHNRNRISANGKFTFDQVISNFYKAKRLSGKRVGIITTFDSMVSPLKLYQYYENHPIEAESLRRVASVNNINTNYYELIGKYASYDEELNFLYSLIKKGVNSYFLKRLYDDKFMTIDKRLEFFDVLYSCCSPLHAKLLVDTKGCFHICEKINEHYPFGNIIDGVNTTKAYELYNELITIRKNKCELCFYHNLCNPCFAQICYDGTKLNVDDKFCEDSKKRIKRHLELYVTFKDIEQWPK